MIEGAIQPEGRSFERLCIFGQHSIVDCTA